MSRFVPLNRRSFLRGAGTLVALPWLEAMLPTRASAQASQAPRRVLSCYFPYGAVDNGFSPSAYGTGFTLPSMLSGSAAFQSRLVLTNGLQNNVAYRHAHYGAAPGFMTGGRVANAGPGCDGSAFMAAGASADIKMHSFLAAGNPGVMHIATGNSKCAEDSSNGFCDGQGGAQAIVAGYQNKLSWIDARTPASHVFGAQALFARLFGSSPPPMMMTTPGPNVNAAADFKKLRGKSVLDSVVGQANALKSRLVASDKLILDQYLSGIRSVESQLVVSQQQPTPQPMTSSCTAPASPGNNLAVNVENNLILDLIALAFVCDRARVASTFLDTEGSGYRVMNFLGHTDNFHTLSHFYEQGGDLANRRKAQFIAGTKYYADCLAYVMNKLSSYREGERDVLYNTFIVFGSGEYSHGYSNLPVVLAGEGGGTMRTGQAVNLQGQPLSNVYLTIMRKLGMTDAAHGNSTGVIAGV